MCEIKNCNLILEMCCNHQGKIETAFEMINEASKSGAKIMKFQKRNISEWANRKPNVYYAPHPCSENSFGKTYKEHREKLELTISEHSEILNYMHSKNLLYSCSVFDVKSCEEILSIGPDFIKIPSACNMNFDLLKFVCLNYDKEIHLSTGMTPKKDIDKIVDFFIKNNKANNLILYACTSGYPVEAKDLNLLEIVYLKQRYKNIVKGIGFSGHHSGILFDPIAYALGADYLERHFTLNRNQKGTDHKVALEVSDVSKLLTNLNLTRLALKQKEKDILDIEIINRDKLKW